MADYITRVVDAEVDAALATLGAVLIEGPRACGKTATGLQHSASCEREGRLRQAGCPPSRTADRC